MKKFKVVLLPLFLVLLTISCYFLLQPKEISAGEKSLVGEESSKSAFVDSCVVAFEVDASTCASTATLTYCVNGGPAMVVPAGTFYIALPCDQTSVICVNSDGCWGRAIVPVTCPCNTDPAPIIIPVVNSPRTCNCM